MLLKFFLCISINIVYEAIIRAVILFVMFFVYISTSEEELTPRKVFVFDYCCSLDVNLFPYYMHTKDSRWKSSLDKDKSKCHNTQILIMPTEFTFTGWMTLLVQEVIIANQYTYSNYFHFLL